MEHLMPPVRKPAVAGQFYPGSPEDLRRTLKSMIVSGPVREAMGVMVPHAGYMYSGSVAGEVYGCTQLPDTFVILGPNHTGMGPSASIMTTGVWQMPAGDVSVDEELANAITSHSRLLATDESAHTFEHSIEVQLPFLQFLVENPSFVPICLMISTIEQCRDIGLAIATAVKSFSRPVLIVASSDMTHYESQSSAQQKDQLALEKILKLDAAGLFEVVHNSHISMCGVAPVATMLIACNELGATRSFLIKYQTSGDVTGDYYQVVGYAGVVIG
jgi:AmmeMemoRadiSam system protein B